MNKFRHPERCSLKGWEMGSLSRRLAHGDACFDQAAWMGADCNCVAASEVATAYGEAQRVLKGHFEQKAKR